MLSMLARGTCLTTLLALVVLGVAAAVGALTDWHVGRVQAVAGIVVFAGLCATVSFWFLVPNAGPAEESAQHRRAPTPDDLRRIATSLAVELPPEYERIMLDFPVRFDRGNCDAVLWNDADALAKRNAKLRSGKHPWPPRYIFIGDDGGGRYYALDLSAPTGSVAAFEGREPGRGEEPNNRTTLDELVAEMIEAAEADGLDPRAESRPPAESLGRRVRGCAIFWLVILGLAGGIGFVMAWSGCSDTN
jgi:hypothetical protein